MKIFILTEACRTVILYF